MFPIPLKYIEKRSGLKLDPYSKAYTIDRQIDRQTDRKRE